MPPRETTANPGSQPHDGPASPWPHRLAWLLAAAVFPLIWVGGLVTTTEAGMAVPDYPTTFGYNPLLYPISTWLNGPWSVFIEHSHRLLAGVIILIASLMLFGYFRFESRAWVRRLALLAEGMVLVQAALGGMRVVLDQRTLAMLHACVAHLFFAVAVSLVVVTSRWWRERTVLQDPAAGAMRQCTLLLPLLVYVQIVFGAAVRHWHQGVWFHVILAMVVAGYVLHCWQTVRRLEPRDKALTRPAFWLVVALVGQLLLGLGTWIVNYGWPALLGEFAWSAGFTVQAYGTGQVLITTAHVALGSLLLVNSVILALRAWRGWVPSPQTSQSQQRASRQDPSSALNGSLMAGELVR